MGLLRRFSSSLLNRTALFVLAFAAAMVLQLGIDQYQNQQVLLPLQQRTEQIRVISQFLNQVEQGLSALDSFRWDYGDSQQLIRQVESAQDESRQLLDQVSARLGEVSEQQYLLASAAKTTYRAYSQLVEQILERVDSGQAGEASEIYYAQARACGGYLRQYTQQLLECTIQDSQSTYQQLTRRSDRLRRVQQAVVALCCVTGAALMASVFTLIHSIRQMAAAARALSSGTLDIPDVEEGGQDEIGQMARAFNEMKRSMRRQVKTLEEKRAMERVLYTKEKETLELQRLMEQEKLQKLRSQINPHFLFNTLNGVLYTAQQEKAEKTQALIGSLSQLFRYALASNTALMPLAQEVRIVEAFYGLQKVRFGSRMGLKWSIDPQVDLTETLAPSFLLQPLVENAFRHGLAPKEEGGCVQIRIRPRDRALQILVQDDGVGMSAQALEQLRKNLGRPSDTGQHIGLYNVSARLRLLGPEYGLKVDSRPGEGTQVELRLPWIQKQEQEEQRDDQDPDCG